MEEEDRSALSGQAEESRYRLLVEAVTDYAIYMIDRDGLVVSWNPGARRFKGYESSEILGKHFSRFYTEEDRQAGLPQTALEVAAREGRFENEGWRVRKDGTRFWAHVVIDPIRDPSGELTGFAKMMRDVTQRKQAQMELEEAREQLLQSQKMEAIGQLTGGVAHDFNNLLMAILASLELLHKKLPDDPELTRLIDNAMQGAQRGASLTQRMLAFARRQPIEPRPVDVSDVIRNMQDLLQRTLGGITPVENDIPAALPLVRADPHQLEVALLNLAVNARDAMPQGGAIHIAAREETVAAGDNILQPGHYICLSVTDTGEGMDEATLQRATEPFFTTKGTGKGTGLGLSAAHGIMEQLEGRLALRSKKGKGTTAELWIPIAEDRPVKAAKLAADLPPQQPRDSSRPLKVLAVDDDALVLMNLVAMLEDLGHEAIEAISAEQALDILKQEPEIDLLITDQAMPRMTGLELVDAIRTNRPDLPVLLATGYAEMPADATQALPKLEKPFLMHHLKKAISDVMVPRSR